MTPRKEPLFGKLEERKLEAFNDIYWAGSIEDRQSSRYYTFVQGSKK